MNNREYFEYRMREYKRAKERPHMNQNLIRVLEQYQYSTIEQIVSIETAIFEWVNDNIGEIANANLNDSDFDYQMRLECANVRIEGVMKHLFIGGYGYMSDYLALTWLVRYIEPDKLWSEIVSLSKKYLE